VSIEPEPGDDRTANHDWAPPSPLWPEDQTTRPEGHRAETFASPSTEQSARRSDMTTAPRWSPRRRRVLGLGIASASAGLIAAIVGGSLSVATVITEALGLTAQPAAPLVEGAPGDPVPMVATDCADPCFSEDHLWEAKLAATDFDRLGTPKVRDPEGWYDSTSGSEQYDQGIAYWRDSELEPAGCMFTATETPTAIVAGESAGSGDSIHWLTSFETENQRSYTLRALRFFATAQQAADHLARLHELVPGCTQYGTPQWQVSVTPMPALDVPDTVAAVGWVESVEEGSRYYAVDVLRANAVIRLTVWTDNTVTEAAFRDLAETMAADMADWPLVVTDALTDAEEQPQAGFQPDQAGADAARQPCTGECFTIEQSLTLVPTDGDMNDLGLRRIGDAAPVADTAGAALDVRQAIETTNAQCRFALGIEPVVRGNPTVGSGARSDALVDLGRFERAGTSIRIVARVFESEARAEAYSGAAEYALSLCSPQTIVTAQGDVQVTMRPAKIAGYDSIDDPIVANRPTFHVGWQHDGGRTDRGHDLQHGNIVVRVIIEPEGGVALSDQEVATLLLPMIARLEALESGG